MTPGEQFVNTLMFICCSWTVQFQNGHKAPQPKWGNFNLRVNCTAVLPIQALSIKFKSYRKENFARSKKYVQPRWHLVRTLFAQIPTGFGKVPGDWMSNYQPHTSASIFKFGSACSIFNLWLYPKQIKPRCCETGWFLQRGKAQHTHHHFQCSAREGVLKTSRSS